MDLLNKKNKKLNESVEEILRIVYMGDWGEVWQYRDDEQEKEMKKRVKRVLISLLSSQRQRIVEEIIELSDKIELERETSFEEWKAFKKFRNTLRDMS